MAIIIPYGDGQAHGSLGNSVSFRRRFGKVVFQKKPHPRQPNSPGQQAQKQKFKEAWKAYHALPVWELEYYRAKAVAEQTTGANLYLSLYLKGQLPSHDPLTSIKLISDMDLPAPIMPNPNDVQVRLIATNLYPSPFWTLGNIYDHENSFIVGEAAASHEVTKINIYNTSGGTKHIPIDYPIIIWWEDFLGVQHQNMIKLPEINFPIPPPEFPAPLNLTKEITGANIVAPAGTDPNNCAFIFWWEKYTPHDLDTFGAISDNANSWLNQGPAIEHDRELLSCQTTHGIPYTSPDDFAFDVYWDDYLGAGDLVRFYLPPLNLAAYESKTFYFDSFWNTYHDSALTQLAKQSWTGNYVPLWIADDFSLYYDKELTLLASTPF